MNLEDKIRSLTRNQAKVLYWKCQGDQYKQIAKRYDKGVKWAQGLMTGAYRKLEVPKGSTPPEISEFLKNNEVCEILQKFVGNPEDLDRWPLYGVNIVETKEGSPVYEVKDKDDSEEIPDPETMADVITETAEEENQETGQEEVETVTGEPVDDEEERRKEDERKRKEEEEKERQRDRPERPPISRNAWLRIFWISATILFLWFVFFRPRLQQNPPQNSSTATQDTSSTEDSNSSPQFVVSPEITSTSGIPPTAVPLPIREDFKGQYSDLWWISGNPLIVDNVWSGYDGVATTEKDQYATMSIGNTAWKNYVVTFRAYRLVDISQLEVGVRVGDLNNMVEIECVPINCHWVIISDGERDQIPGDQAVTDNVTYTFTVQDNSFILLAKSVAPDVRMSLVLPPKYKDKFQSGGVLFRFKDVEFDFIEINPLP